VADISSCSARTTTLGTGKTKSPERPQTTAKPKTRVCARQSYINLLSVFVTERMPVEVIGQLQIPGGTNACKGKAIPLQVWSGPEDSWNLRFPDFMTTAQDGGKVVSLTHWPPLPQETHLLLISVRG
jgi:hypothetical protein